MTNIGFVGSGMMAEAIIGGMLKGGFLPSEIWGADPQAGRREYMKEKYGIHVTASNREMAAVCGVLVLAVKPQYYPDAAKELRGALTGEHRIISIMAGITTARLEAELTVSGGAGKATGKAGEAGPLAVVRVMPNTPALAGAGVTALCPGSRAGSADVELAKKIFRAVGSVTELEERLMDAFTGVAGCGPAYVYMMIEALADGGVMMGLPRQLAQIAAAEMVKGSAQMVLSGAGHPGDLKDKVCSPGGSTIEGVYTLEQSGFRGALMSAVRAAVERNRQLG